MINLVQAFSVAVKHLLRGEPGVYYEDLYPLVCFLPRYASEMPSDADMLPLWKASELVQLPGTRTATLDLPELPSTRSEKSQMAGSDIRPEMPNRHSSRFTTLGEKSAKRKATFDPEKGK